MDFWDITKLLVRRWWVVLPMLVLSGALAIGAMSRVKPDYIATAYVQLVPPVSGETKPGQTTVDQRNPFIGLGLQTIGNAAIVTVTDLSVADQLHASGLTDAYTVTMAQTSPLITFEIVGHTQEQARQTADELIARFDKSVADIQTRYGVTKTDSITSVRLDAGTNIKESTSKIKRALIAVAAAGLLLTIATTVGVDAWLRRRQRRRAEAEPAAAMQPSLAASSRRIPAVVPRTVGSGARAAGVAGQESHNNGDHWSEPYVVTMTNPANGSPAAGAGKTDGPEGGLPNADVDRTQQITLQTSAPEEELALPVPSDATIVLPRVRPQPFARPTQGD